ncbi:hypothetical protein G9A89_015231 [Geosiphon pyriformis]|nr:hypothetical protein G9A89_015231 [Geosiphon pyriformis]
MVLETSCITRGQVTPVTHGVVHCIEACRVVRHTGGRGRPVTSGVGDAVWSACANLYTTRRLDLHSGYSLGALHTCIPHGGQEMPCNPRSNKVLRVLWEEMNTERRGGEYIESNEHTCYSSKDPSYQAYGNSERRWRHLVARYAGHYAREEEEEKEKLAGERKDPEDGNFGKNVNESEENKRKHEDNENYNAQIIIKTLLDQLQECSANMTNLILSFQKYRRGTDNELTREEIMDLSPSSEFVLNPVKENDCMQVLKEILESVDKFPDGAFDFLCDFFSEKCSHEQWEIKLEDITGLF